jgi:hypothetical protein
MTAWLVMGATWRAAFLSPFAVLVPGTALILTHATMFENFMALPAVLVTTAAFQGVLLIMLLCARIAASAVAAEAAQIPARIPAQQQKPRKVKRTYLIREVDDRGQPLREWQVKPGAIARTPGSGRVALGKG